VWDVEPTVSPPLCPPSLLLCAATAALCSARLSDHSLWLSSFEEHISNSDEHIELPGQYTGETCPAPERHRRLVSCDPTVLVMGSLRRPKRLTLHANDERDYPFLIKGGEDLRMDQRIQQLFGTMRELLRQDPKCVARDLTIRTYQVVPVSPTLGMIEWLPNTNPIKSVISAQAKRVRANDITYDEHFPSLPCFSAPLRPVYRASPTSR
jgi:phosphatidylinositol kinase/protein kinase (PI-3  family)